ncbi:MAG: exodeoxyribonuclease I [Candidatus Nomurabacteria bacterium]|jgi:exodeoxyribonuclease-1|nr:exodeoxyribonuclease I [Candidatus Nomurabacteria bacterium]
MEQSFFFYDLETSGLMARADRIMQFAGQRTDLDLSPIGEPVNLMVKLAEDTLPSPYAIRVTGITPQQTVADGISEVEFCKYVAKEIFVPGTVAVGYNSVRFDDEFMRFCFWRNFFDAYEWQWRDGRSRWDLLDVVRLTRALRPEGIKWPVDKDGKATNRLELLTKLNGIAHEAAHDALSDVEALIDVTKMIREKQPQLFEYLFKMRNKKEVMKLVNLENLQPVVYASGRYSGEFDKTTVVWPLAPAPNGNLLVFDLRYNLEELGERENYFPIVKELKYNHCPAVAPVGVLEQNDGWGKIGLSPEVVQRNRDCLLKHPEFAEKMRTLCEERPEFPPAVDAESALYDGFLDGNDRVRCDAVRAARDSDLADFHPEFADPRLAELLLHYKGRNFPHTLDAQEQEVWEKYRVGRLKAQRDGYVKAIQELSSQGVDPDLLQELQLWLDGVATALVEEASMGSDIGM